MTDCFALLGVERRPWLDPGEVKEKYHRLTARHHPDVVGAEGDFAEINRAYQTLSDPAARLRHLLDLEAPGTIGRAQPVPEDVAGCFADVAQTSQGFDAFLKKHAAAASPLAKALLSAEQYNVQERLEEIIGRLQEKQESVLAQVHEVDALWIADRAAALRSLPALWQSLGYTGKWLATLRESLFRLAAL